MSDTPLRDLLPDDGENKLPRVKRGGYICCLVIWLVSLAAIPIFAVFNGGAGVYYIVMILLTVAGAFVSGFAFVRSPFTRMHLRGRFQRLVFAVMIICLFISLASFVVFGAYGGNPQALDDGWAIVSHNNVVRSITEKEYRALCAAESIGFSAALAFFTSAILLFAKRDAED